MRLSAVHVLMLSQDEEAVREALRSVPRKRRPHLRTECFGFEVLQPPTDDDGAAASDRGTQDTASSSEQNCAIVVERTFFTLRQPCDGNDEASWLSAPSRLEHSS